MPNRKLALQVPRLWGLLFLQLVLLLLSPTILEAAKGPHFHMDAAPTAALNSSASVGPALSAEQGSISSTDSPQESAHDGAAATDANPNAPGDEPDGAEASLSATMDDSGAAAALAAASAPDRKSVV